MRDVLLIRQDQLKSMLPLRQTELHLRLSAAEMDVIGIAWYWRIEGRGIGIDDEVVVPGIGLAHPSRRHAHVAQAKSDR